MSGTILQTLPKMVDGLMLFESFESVNFMTDQGWTLEQGVPTITNAASFEGLKSLIMDSTHPFIHREFSTPFRFSAGYFLDDTTEVGVSTIQGIFWDATGGATNFGIGIQIAVSSVNYSVLENGIAVNSGIARVDGWHRFEMTYDGSNIKQYIDGVLISTVATVLPTSFTIVKVGSQSSIGTPFGYFDLVTVCADFSLTVTGLQDGQTATLYDSSNAVLATATVTSGSAVLNMSALDSPFESYLVITAIDGRPLFRSQTQSFSSGDEYTLAKYSFGRRPASLDVKATANRQDRESNSGKQQSVFFYARDMVSMTFTDLTEDEKNKLMRWWTTAQRGEGFACALNEEATYLSALSVAIGSVGAVTFTPVNAIGTNKGSVLAIRTATGRYRDTKKVSGVSAGVVTVDEAFVEPFSVGDQVRDLYYWPNVLTTDAALNVTLTNVKYRRWSVSLSFKEAL